MEVSNAFNYPSFYAKQQISAMISSPEFLALAALDKNIQECIKKITSSTFPIDFQSELSLILSSNISQVAKKIFKNSILLLELSRLFENPSSTSDQIFSILNQIEEETLSKVSCFELLKVRITNELVNASCFEDIKRYLPLIRKLPPEILEEVDSLIFSIGNRLINFSNDDILYISSTLASLEDFINVTNYEIIISNLFERLIQKFQVYEITKNIDESLKKHLGIVSKQDLQSALYLLSRLSFNEKYNEFIASSCLKFDVQKFQETSSTILNNGPFFTFSSNLRQGFKCSVDGVNEILEALPIISWNQIRHIDWIIKSESKGIEVSKAVIQLDGNEKTVAVKTSLSKFKDPSISMQAECMALVQDHPYFLKLYGAFWDIFKKKYRFTLVMELASETLTEKINGWNYTKTSKAIREEEALKAAINLIEAMTVLNQKNISHRDIKPDNIFITSDNAYKIADFDVSKKIERDCYGVTQINTKVSISGTKNYMSPELNAFASGILLEYGIDYNKSDVYSLGITILRMITDKNFLSWNAKNDRLQHDIHDIIDENIDNEKLKKILKSMLVVEPLDRPKFRELKRLCGMQEATVVEEDFF